MPPTCTCQNLYGGIALDTYCEIHGFKKEEHGGYILNTAKTQSPAFNPINRPQHYTSHPSGIECITITEHFSFCLGNAIKYIWRADQKNGLEDLKKAQWYIQREIALRENKK